MAGVTCERNGSERYVSELSTAVRVQEGQYRREMGIGRVTCPFFTPPVETKKRELQ